MANPIYHYKYIENDRPKWYNLIDEKITKKAVIIYRQELMQDISLFVSQPKAKFYDELFFNIDLSDLETLPYKTGRKEFPKEALFCAFIVMKSEGFSQITDLVDYLDNNRLIAYYCGFDIRKDLPSYWTYDRFIKDIDNDILKKVMQTQVLKLAEMGIIDTSFIGLDSIRFQQTPGKITQNRFLLTNFPKKIILVAIKTANWVSTPLQINTMNAITSFIGVTKAMFSLI